MRIDRLGEHAAILRDLDSDAAALAEAIEAAKLPGLVEAVASYETVGVFFSDGFQLELLSSIRASGREAGRLLEIPVCYEFGEDLSDVCQQKGIDAGRFVETHTSFDYRCFAVGFCPGFPYLGYLPEEIAGIRRLAVPRTRIEPGSVGVTGRQTGVYPLATPGGWPIIGRTPLVLVDVDDGYFPIRAGDRIRFSAIDPVEFERLRGERL